MILNMIQSVCLSGGGGGGGVGGVVMGKLFSGER